MRYAIRPKYVEDNRRAAIQTGESDSDRFNFTITLIFPPPKQQSSLKFHMSLVFSKWNALQRLWVVQNVHETIDEIYNIKVWQYEANKDGHALIWQTINRITLPLFFLSSGFFLFFPVALTPLGQYSYVYHGWNDSKKPQSSVRLGNNQSLCLPIVVAHMIANSIVRAEANNSLHQ